MNIHLSQVAGREASVPLQNIEFKARDKLNVGNKKCVLLRKESGY